jgi:SAM-dependent methyltransferase
MSCVSDHYRQLLSEHYVWMFGVPFEDKVAEQKALLDRVLSALQPPVPHGPALDLGSGPGFQSIALAELGFSPVIAIDTSAELLAELNARCDANIETMTADIASLESLDLPAGPTIAVCMGDTLTHLSSRDDVECLFAAVFNKLAPQGAFILTWRDLTHELTGTDRFLSVRSDDQKIMTCFLEYESSDSVLVHDLVHIHQPEGWVLHKSSYRKLRLSSAWVSAALRNAGFRVDLQEPGRLHLIAARKPYP